MARAGFPVRNHPYNPAMCRRPLTAAVPLLVAAVLVRAQPPPPPTVAVLNGRVFTGVASRPWAEAIAVRGERITAVGTSQAIRALAGPETKVIDAAGRLVVPGFNDAHVHVGVSRITASLEGPPATEHDPTLDEILARLRTAVSDLPPGSWVGGEIGAAVLDDPKATRYALDEVAPDHPVVLSNWTGHGKLLNTAALRRLGAGDEEPDPPGGTQHPRALADCRAGVRGEDDPEAGDHHVERFGCKGQGHRVRR